MNVSYAAIMALAIAAGIAVSRLVRVDLGLTPGKRIGIALGAFCGGFLGAKLPFVLADWEGFLDGSAWFDDGKTITFGLLGGYVGVELTKWALDVRVKTGDAFAVPVAVSIGVGRLACFTAGCCHGVETTLPWACDFGDGVLRHPTQLYEVAFHLTAALALALLLRRGAFRGQLIKLYIIGYFAYRFATELIRPEPRVALGLTVYQWAALVFVPVFVCLYARDARALRDVARRSDGAAGSGAERVGADMSMEQAP